MSGEETDGLTVVQGARARPFAGGMVLFGMCAASWVCSSDGSTAR